MQLKPLASVGIVVAMVFEGFSTPLLFHVSINGWSIGIRLIHC